jgi:hypothetical protein
LLHPFTCTEVLQVTTSLVLPNLLYRCFFYHHMEQWQIYMLESLQCSGSSSRKWIVFQHFLGIYIKFILSEDRVERKIVVIVSYYSYM